MPTKPSSQKLFLRSPKHRLPSKLQVIGNSVDLIIKLIGEFQGQVEIDALNVTGKLNTVRIAALNIRTGVNELIIDEGKIIDQEEKNEGASIS